jgi:molecular chaperone DnaK
MTASQKMGEALYAEQAASASGAESNAEKGEDNVVDAEFEEVKDKKPE